MSRSVGVLAHAAVPTRAESPGLSGRVGATLEQRYRGGAVSLRETQTHGCSEMLRRTTQHVNTKLLAAEIPCTTAGTGATIPLLARSRVLRRGGHVRPASRVPPARPRRTREAPQAAGPGGGAEFVTEPRDHHALRTRLCLVNSNRRATPFRPGIVHCIWANRAVTGSAGRFRTGVKSIRHWSRFTSQAFVKRHYIKLHTCKMYNIRTTDARDHL